MHKFVRAKPCSRSSEIRSKPKIFKYNFICFILNAFWCKGSFGHDQMIFTGIYFQNVGAEDSRPHLKLTWPVCQITKIMGSCVMKKASIMHLIDLIAYHDRHMIGYLCRCINHATARLRLVSHAVFYHTCTIVEDDNG